MAPPQAVLRLQKEYNLFKQSVQNMTLQGCDVAPDPNNSLKWHFVLFDFDSDSPYHRGYYHGVITYPSEYPFKPPNIQFRTPSGRFLINTPICFSMSDFHPESWVPTWTMQTLLLGIRSFMEDPADPAAHGSIRDTLAKRREFAIQSGPYNQSNPEFISLFPTLLKSATTAS